jgi:hypothetical protein
MWDDQNEGETDDVVSLYREAGMPPIKVYSQLKGDVHIRRDIHPLALCKSEAGCDNWNPDKRHRKPKVSRQLRTQPGTESTPVSTANGEAGNVSQETIGQSE